MSRTSKSMVFAAASFSTAYLLVNAALLVTGAAAMRFDLATQVVFSYSRPHSVRQGTVLGRIRVANPGSLPESIHLRPIFACDSMGRYVEVSLWRGGRKQTQPLAFWIGPGESAEVFIVTGAPVRGRLQVRDTAAAPGWSSCDPQFPSRTMAELRLP